MRLLKYIFVVVCCSFISEKETGYNFSKPITAFDLPPILHEISGVAVIDSSTAVCIQDENGILFFYDFLKNKIVKQQFFTMNGDYEGIARVGKSIYVLRSDGVLFHITDYSKAESKIETIVTGMPCDNNEGLCYDADNNRLLIGCKGKPGKGPENNGLRVIYSFDTKTKKLSEKPVFTFNLNEAKALALKKGIKLGEKKTKNGTLDDYQLSFFISGMAIHPVTKKLYTVSSRDHLIFMVNTEGKIEHIEQLDPVKFNKPEGIAFLPNGDALISNEGQNKQPSIYRFGYIRTND